MIEGQGADRGTAGRKQRVPLRLEKRGKRCGKKAKKPFEGEADRLFHKRLSTDVQVDSMRS
jgi:hypothetical protein